MLKTLKAVCIACTVLTAGSWTIYALEKDKKRREIYKAILQEIALTKGIRMEEIPPYLLEESISRVTKLSNGPEVYLSDLIKIAKRKGISLNKSCDDIHTRKDILDHGMFI